MEWKVPTQSPGGSPAQKVGHAVPHLSRRLVGKGEGENGVRRHVAGVKQIGNAIGEHAGLSAPGSGQDEKRTVDGLHRFTLGRVQLLQQVQFGIS